jgi:hypothetical protein
MCRRCHLDAISLINGFMELKNKVTSYNDLKFCSLFITMLYFHCVLVL